MNNIKKAAYKSPILGSLFLTLLSIVYICIFVLSSDNTLSNNIIAVINIIPILFIFFSIISYIISIPVGFFLYREMERNLREYKFFINFSLLIGFILSLVIALIDYSLHYTLAKCFFIVIGISLMATMNANYFLVLARIIKIKEIKNEETKGSRV